MKNITKVFACVLTAFLVMALAKLPVQAAPVTLPDGTVFDPEFYAQQYPDVAAAVGTSPQALYNHYILFGKAEGRAAYAGAGTTTAVVIPADFNAAFYAEHNPDVVAALGNDPAVLYKHYVMFGKKEGRLPNADNYPGSGTTVTPVTNYTGIALNTTDLNGNPVNTKDIFSTHKYTMVNLWASWCGPCRSELDELGSLAKTFESKGCAIVGLLYDDDTAYARRLLANAGASYLNIMDTSDLDRVFDSYCVPTSFFVDQNGRIVGDPIEGAAPYLYLSTLEELLAR